MIEELGHLIFHITKSLVTQQYQDMNMCTRDILLTEI